MQNDQAMPPQPPRSGCWLVGIPIFVAAFWIVAYSIVFFYGIRGRSADGPIKEMVFATCPEGFDVIITRAKVMGLGQIKTQTQEDAFVLSAQLPSHEQSVAEIPKTLAATGSIEIFTHPDTAEQQLAAGPDDITAISLEVNHTGSPYLKLSLARDATVHLQRTFSEDQEAQVEIRLDHQPIRRFTLRSLGRNLSRIKLEPPADTHQEEIEIAAKWSMLLHHPLPCPARLIAVTP